MWITEPIHCPQSGGDTYIMKLPHYAIWMNGVYFYAIWFIGVWGRETVEPWLFLMIGAHLLMCRDRGRELAVMIACGALGSSVDAILALIGVFVFDPPPELLPVPLWLIALWLGFGGTFRHSLNWFVQRPAFAIVAAAIGAPLSYLAAARMGAVDLPYGHFSTGVGLGVLWVFLMAALVFITRTLTRKSASLEHGA